MRGQQQPCFTDMMENGMKEVCISTTSGIGSLSGSCSSVSHLGKTAHNGHYAFDYFITIAISCQAEKIPLFQWQHRSRIGTLRERRLDVLKTNSANHHSTHASANPLGMNMNHFSRSSIKDSSHFVICTSRQSWY